MKVSLVLCVTTAIFGSAYSQLLNIPKGKDCLMKDDTKGVCTLGSECEYSKTMNSEGRIKEVPVCSFSGIHQVFCCPIATSSPPARILPMTTVEIPSPDDPKGEQYCSLIKNQPTAELVPEVDHHIFNGVFASKRELPHMVAIGYTDDLDDEIKYRCGGALISRSWVITASHCLKRGMKQVRVGSVSTRLNQSYELPQEIEIKNYYKHPSYTSKEKYNDIALLELAHPVRTDQGIVKPICLPALAFTEENDDYIIAGWGYVNKTHQSDRLLRAEIKEHNQTHCQRTFAHLAKTTSELKDGIVGTQICAENKNTKSDTCQGDSGGPMFWKEDGVFHLRGITSFGLSAACSIVGGAPGIYTRVDAYLDWIEGLVWPNDVTY